MNEYAERHRQLADTLRQRFAGNGCEVIEGPAEVTLVIPAAELIRVATELRDGEAFRFEELIDVCGVDYSQYGRDQWATGTETGCGFGRGIDVEAAAAGEEQERRFAAVYHLLSVSRNQRLRLRVFVDSEHPLVDSVVGIWNSANWFEREAFDLFGILFDGHPDLRRILTDYGFVGHPFRKDFPLSGEVEMRYDAERQRVVYEPVSIEPRLLGPKVIRHDNRYLDEANETQDAGDA